MKPHWINESGRAKGSIFICSECGGRCFCLYFGANKKINKCNYQYCPRCGRKMDIESGTKYVKVEVQE